MSLAVLAGAVGAFVLVRGTVSERLSAVEPGEPQLCIRVLLRFYAPLALTSLIVLGGQPLLAVALGRSQDALVALAVWPVVASLAFVFRSGGYAHQEVVVALYDRPGAGGPLWRFTLGLAATLSGAMALLAATPLAAAWLAGPGGLTRELITAARWPLIVLVPAPALSVLVSWFRGRLVCASRTTVITQAVAVNLFTLATVVGVAVWRGPSVPGAVVASTALVLSLVTETVFLSACCRPVGGREPPEGALRAATPG